MSNETPTQPLTPEQINVLIAESLGWTEIETLGEGPYNDRRWAFYTDEPNGFADDTYKLGSIVGKYNPKAKLGHIPNFHGSLDACHDMEKSLTESERLFYDEALHAILKLGYELDDDTRLSGWSVFETAHATSPQRCLAYLKTKGLIK